MTTVDYIITAITLFIGGGGLGWFLHYRAQHNQMLADAKQKIAEAKKLDVERELALDESETKVKIALNESYEIRLDKLTKRVDALENENTKLRKDIGIVLDENNDFRKRNYNLSILFQRLLDVVYDILKEDQNISSTLKARVEAIKAEFATAMTK